MCVCVCMYEVFTAETDTIPRSLSIVDLFLLFSTTGVCCVCGRWCPLCPPQNTKRASWHFPSQGDFISVWSGGLGFGKISGRRGGYRTQMLLGHGLACLLSRCFMSHSHATELQYHPGDNVTRAGGSLQMTQNDGEGFAREKLLLEVRVKTNGKNQSQLMQRRATRCSPRLARLPGDMSFFCNLNCSRVCCCVLGPGDANGVPQEDNEGVRKKSLLERPGQLRSTTRSGIFLGQIT